MKRCTQAIAVAVLLLFLGTSHTHAFAPKDWVFFTGPYAYSHNQYHWFYVNPTDVMWCYDFAAGNWVSFPGSFDGWVYFDWPYGYSLNNARWYYFEGTCLVNCFNLVTQWWQPFGALQYWPSDGAGTWAINQFTVHSADQYVHTGWLSVKGDNSFLGQIADRDNMITGVFGSLSVDTDGDMTLSFTSTPSPVPLDLCSSKTHAVGSSESLTGPISYMYMLVRRSSTYAQSDLTGTWSYQGIDASDTHTGITTGSIAIAAAGTFSTDFKNQAGTSESSIGVAAMDPNGLIVFGDGLGATLALFDLSATKDVFVRAATEGPSDYSSYMGIGIKRAASYTLADAVGTWPYNAIFIDDTDQSTERGTLCLYADGTFTVDWYHDNGASGSEGGTFTVTAGGMIDLGLIKMQLSASKSVFAGARYMGESILIVGVRNAE